MLRGFAYALAHLAALGCGFALSVVLAQPMPGDTGKEALAEGLPGEGPARERLKGEFAQIAAEQNAQGGPTYLLPEDQRPGWIAAWNRMRDCAQTRGFDGVTPVAATYGDGRTPAPVVHGSAPEVEAILKACPMDTTLFDAEKVATALREQPSRPPSR